MQNYKESNAELQRKPYRITAESLRTTESDRTIQRVIQNYKDSYS